MRYFMVLFLGVHNQKWWNDLKTYIIERHQKYQQKNVENCFWKFSKKDVFKCETKVVEENK